MCILSFYIYYENPITFEIFQYFSYIFKFKDFENWAWWRTGDGKMSPDDVDTSLCTHLIYSFAILDESTLQMKIHDQAIDKSMYLQQSFVYFRI